MIGRYLFPPVIAYNMSPTVFITGTSSGMPPHFTWLSRANIPVGIGYEAAKLFHQNGYNVVATMRQPESAAGQELAAQPNTLVTKLDLVDVNTINAAVEAAIAKFGKIDVLVNNAGYGQNGLMEAVSREKIQEQFDTNVFGKCCSNQVFAECLFCKVSSIP